jgi:hypothetical protein
VFASIFFPSVVSVLASDSPAGQQTAPRLLGGSQKLAARPPG